MESTAAPIPESRSIDLARLKAACDEAATIAAAQSDPAVAIEAALEVLHARLDHGGVAAFVLEHDRLWSMGVRGYAMIPDGLPLGEGVIGRAVREQSVRLVLDTEVDPDFIEVLHNVVSELAIPLVTDAGVVGLINIETTSRLPAGGDTVVTQLARVLARPMEELRATRTVSLSSLARLFVYMSSLRDSRTIADVTVRSIGRVLPIEMSQLLLVDESGRFAECAHWRASDSCPEPLSVSVLEELCAGVGQAAVFELLDTSSMHVPALAGSRVRSVVVIPLRANGQEVGMLVGASRFAKEFDREQGEIAALLAAHAAASIDAALALGRERESAHTDPLTGLLNRRGLEDRLDRELAAAQDDRRPLSLIVLDCDDFKDVNDRAGHEFGDALLRETGIVLRAVCPEGSSAARLGGDEFVVMLPETDADAALEIATRLRFQLDAGLDKAGFPLRLSAGLSTYPYDGAAASQLLRAADQALYQAKAEGKNRIVSFHDIVRGDSSPAAGVIRPSAPERRRGGGKADGSMLADALEAVTAICAEGSVDAVIERLSKSLTFVTGATGSLISRVDGSRLVDLVCHALRDVDLDATSAYLIDDFPVTKEVLDSGEPRSISFLDENLDRAEAFVLRELEMNCALLLAIVVDGTTWGLAEVYDKRLRRFTRDDESVSAFLVAQAARRIEALGGHGGQKKRWMPLFRLPSG